MSALIGLADEAVTLAARYSGEALREATGVVRVCEALVREDSGSALTAVTGLAEATMTVVTGDDGDLPATLCDASCSALHTC